MQKVNMSMFEDPRASTPVAVIRVTCHPEVHVVLETCVDESFVYAKESTNLLDLVPISEEENGYSGLEVTGFRGRHGRGWRQQHVIEWQHCSGSDT
jgi:hypothetical protein